MSPAAGKRPVDLSVSLAGIRLKNPVIAASGTFGYGTEYDGLAAEFGAVITKTVTLASRPGNAPPRLCETASGMLNSIGLANVGIDAFISGKLPALAGLDTAVIANIAGDRTDEYAALARRLDSAPGIAALEVNISCPNVNQGGSAFGADPAAAAAVTAAVRRVTGLPLIVKLTPNVSDIIPVARAVEAAGADALSLINTLFGMRIDIERRRPALGGVTGGLSGPAILPVALYHVHRAARAVSIPVIGLGGISSACDAIEFMLAGAAAVQIGTATFVEPGTVRAVTAGLEAYCLRHGLARASSITGRLLA